MQVAAAYHHILSGNFNGAAKMFLRVRQLIEPFPDFCKGVNVTRLRQSVNKVHQRLLGLSPEHINEFDKSLMIPIEYIIEN